MKAGEKRVFHQRIPTKSIPSTEKHTLDITTFTRFNSPEHVKVQVEGKNHLHLKDFFIFLLTFHLGFKVTVLSQSLSAWSD